MKDVEDVEGHLGSYAVPQPNNTAGGQVSSGFMKRESSHYAKRTVYNSAGIVPLAKVYCEVHAQPACLYEMESKDMIDRRVETRCEEHSHG